MGSLKTGGRKRSVDMQAIAREQSYTSFVQVVRARMLPNDFPKWKTVYHYFRQWRQDRTWQQIHERLRLWVRVEEYSHRDIDLRTCIRND
ncbi:transposase [Plectonema radiosum]|uniref:transposase n=1 Tax=Plectonema radiosum TaxID=945768 RepID=UPI0035C8B97A